MSFRTRLALASSAAVAVAVILASGGAYLLVRDSLRGEVDGALRDRAALPEVLPRLVVPRQLPPTPFGGASGYFQIVSADGEIAPAARFERIASGWKPRAPRRQRRRG